MPVFIEDPSQFSKSRLKSDLIANNVALPPGESKKEVYVELYLKHVDHQNAADFSSDEEDQLQDVVEEEKEEDPEMLEASGLTDDELKAALLKHGVKAGPIVASTRALYERKLKLLQADVQPVLNGAGDVGQYSDSEEEEENAEETGPEQAAEKMTSHVDQDQQESCQESVADVLTELFPDDVPTATGISATRRRPIKGAAGRPVQYKHLDIPVSPVTLEIQEPQRRLVPLSVQVVVFLVVACLLYLIYVYMEDSSSNPFVALMDNLGLESDGQEGLSLQSETQDMPVPDPPSGQEYPFVTSE